MKILFKYPTRGRAKWFVETLNTYYGLLSNKYPFQFVITMDIDDSTMYNSEIKNFLQTKQNLNYCYGYHKNKIDAINDNMNGFDFDILVLVSDDMIPIVQNYDEIIVEQMKNNFPDTNGALHFDDGFLGKDQTITLSIMGKKLYDRIGYIYHPDYKSFYCDNEFTDVVRNMNCVKYIPQVIIKHEWKGFRPNKDDIYKKNSILGKDDGQTYNLRKQRNFPKESVLGVI